MAGARGAGFLRRGGWRAFAAGLLAALVIAPTTASTPAIEQHAVPLKAKAPPPPRAPAALQAKLDDLAAAYGEPIGIAVSDLEAGWTAQVRGDEVFPQQSVSKLWVALAVLDAVDRGERRLDDVVVLGPTDRSVFFQPVASQIVGAGYMTTLHELLSRALSQSDNAANDKLIREVGGVEAVTAALDRKGLGGLRVGAYERDLQAGIAGLSWRPEYGIGWNFQAARAELPQTARDAALEAYLADPADGVTPVAIVNGLSAIERGDALSPLSRAVMLQAMAEARTGPRRLKGGLSPGWSLAHKTGTGQDWRGASIGINDVGLMTAPDGRTYAVAVMIRRTFQPVPARLEMMQGVSRAIVETWDETYRPLTTETRMGSPVTALADQAAPTPPAESGVQ
jgi:beta-lactamase class A